MCLSVHRGSTWAGTPSWAGKLLRQVHPRAGTSPDQVNPSGRYTPWAGTPPRQVHTAETAATATEHAENSQTAPPAGWSQNTVPLASTQAAIKGTIQYSTRQIQSLNTVGSDASAIK